MNQSFILNSSVKRYAVNRKDVAHHVSTLALWLFLAIFLTPVSVTAQVTEFPFEEGFDVAVPPSGWTIVDVDGDGQSWVRYGYQNPGDTHTGTGCAVHWSNSAIYENGELVMPQTGLLITPALSIPADGDYELEFWHHVIIIGLPDNNAYTGVWVSTSGIDVENGAGKDWKESCSFEEVEEVFPGVRDESGVRTVWVKSAVNLSKYAGQTIHIAFVYESDNNHRWCIDDVRIYNAEITDAEVTAITTPASGENLSANEEVKVTVRNNGKSIELSEFKLKLELNGIEIATEDYDGEPIPGGETAEYTFKSTLDLSETGFHEITVTVIAENDEVPENDAKTKTVECYTCTVTEFPFMESFSATTFPPRCWTTLGTAWVRNTVAAYVYSTPSSAASAVVGNGWLVTPQISIPDDGNFELKFMSYHQNPQYQQYGGYSGIWISETGNDEASFTELKELDSEITAEWKELTVSLSEYAGKNIYIGFKQLDMTRWYIDDLSIYDLDTYMDAELVAITEPVAKAYINLSDSEEVKVTVKNNSTNELTEFDLDLKLEQYNTSTFDYIEISTITEHFTEPVPAGEEGECTFTGIDLSADMMYRITVTLKVDGNIATGNLSKNIAVTNVVCNTVTEFPWKESFESSTFKTDCWQRPTGWAIINSPAGQIHSGQRSVRNSGNIMGSDDLLITPPIALPAGENYVLKFWSYTLYPTDNYYSGVWVSTTDKELASFTEEYVLSGDDISQSWKEITLSLSEYAGETVYIGFRYQSEEFVPADAWVIDDISVGYVDGEIAEIITPATGDQLTASEDVTVLIKNNGIGDLTGFDLILELDGAEQAVETFTAVIPSGGEAEYTFSEKLDLSEKFKEFTVKVTIDAEWDNVDSNNSKTQTVISQQNITGATVTVTPESYVYSGTPVTPESVEVSLSDVALTADVDYTWAITSVDGEETSAGVNAGTVTITVTGENKYAGTITETFDIVPKELTISGFNVVKYYDGDNNVTGFGELVFDGLVNGETANVDESDVTATYASSDKGEHDITITGDFGMTGGTALASNYVITQPTGITGTIKPIINSVVVSPQTSSVVKGSTQQFTVSILGSGNPAQTVTWTVEGSSNSGTSVSESGLLTVGNSETTGINLTVRATSTDDNTKSGVGTVIVTGITSSGEIPQDNPLKAWIRNDQLHVIGLTAGETLTVYNAAGALVYITIVDSTEADINLSVSGAYIVRSGNHTIKVVY